MHRNELNESEIPLKGVYKYALVKYVLFLFKQ